MTSQRSARLVSLVPLVFVALSALTGCGDDDSSSSATDSTPSSSADAGSGDIVVTAKDFSFDKEAITAPAGQVTIQLINMGQAEHEFVLLKTDEDPTSLAVGDDGRVDEADSVGEVEEVEGGKSGTHTFALEPGKYVFVCNIPGHYKDGMAGELTVS